MKDKIKNEWFCKLCGLDLNWKDKEGKLTSPNHCPNCRAPSEGTHYRNTGSLIMEDKIENKLPCEHKLIHTSRLLKDPDSETTEYIIEKICADCGQWLGVIEVYK